MVTRKKGLTSKIRKPRNQVTRKGPFSGLGLRIHVPGAPERLGKHQELHGYWTQCQDNVTSQEVTLRLSAEQCTEPMTTGDKTWESKGSHVEEGRRRKSAY